MLNAFLNKKSQLSFFMHFDLKAALHVSVFSGELHLQTPVSHRFKIHMYLTVSHLHCTSSLAGLISGFSSDVK